MTGFENAKAAAAAAIGDIAVVTWGGTLNPDKALEGALRAFHKHGYTLKPTESSSMDNPIILNASGPYEITPNAREGATLWKEFLESGSVHSANARLLPYIIRRCEREQVAYILEAQPGEGYFIRPRKVVKS